MRKSRVAHVVNERSQTDEPFLVVVKSELAGQPVRNMEHAQAVVKPRVDSSRIDQVRVGQLLDAAQLLHGLRVDQPHLQLG